MQGMSEREYAAHAGLSRGAIQKAKSFGRLMLHADGSIDAAASDARRASQAAGESHSCRAPAASSAVNWPRGSANVRVQAPRSSAISAMLRWVWKRSRSWRPPFTGCNQASKSAVADATQCFLRSGRPGFLGAAEVAIVGVKPSERAARLELGHRVGEAEIERVVHCPVERD